MKAVVAWVAKSAVRNARAMPSGLGRSCVSDGALQKVTKAHATAYDKSKLANGKRAAELVEACVAQAGAPPSLVLVADLSCSAALIQPLVDSLVALGACLQPGAVAIVAHERREGKVDAALSEAMARARLVAEPLRVPEHLLTPSLALADAKKKKKALNCERTPPVKSRLQMWSMQLRVQ